VFLFSCIRADSVIDPRLLSSARKSINYFYSSSYYYRHFHYFAQAVEVRRRAYFCICLASVTGFQLTRLQQVRVCVKLS
jgi:hypothetical protein